MSRLRSRGLDLFGFYVPGHSPFHRLGAGWKMVALGAGSLVPMIVRLPWVTGVVLVVALVTLGVARVGWRRAFRLPWLLLVMLAAIAAYQGARGRADLMVVVPGNVLIAVFLARLLMLTTPLPDLLDALTRVLPERAALAVALMVRSIGTLFGAVDQVRDAARARGLDRHPVALLAPVVVWAIAHALATGDALVARGLGEGGERRR